MGRAHGAAELRPVRSLDLQFWDATGRVEETVAFRVLISLARDASASPFPPALTYCTSNTAPSRQDPSISPGKRPSKTSMLLLRQNLFALCVLAVLSARSAHATEWYPVPDDLYAARQCAFTRMPLPSD
jgi:hypothetical protein